MARFPIMPVFTDALIADTAHLTAEEFGAYALILVATWRNNGQAFPDDDKRLARVARVSLPRWRTRLRPVLVEFFDLSDGCWHQKRLEAEWARAEASSQKQSGRARKGRSQKPLPFDAAKALNTQNSPLAAAQPRHSHCAGSAAAQPTITKEATLPEDESPLSNPESVAAREPEKDEGENPGGRCAPLVASCRRRDTSKSPELKLKIRRQLASKHCRYLHACGRPGELVAYFEAMAAGEGGIPEAGVFNAVDRRMRASNWDDMRWWRDRQARPRAGPDSVDAMMLRQGWFHGKAAAAAA